MIKLLIYSVITMIVIFIILYYCHKKIPNDSTKDIILKVFAILTVVIHYSSLWIDYLTKGIAVVENTMLFPIYPCNVCMWLVLIVAFMKNKDTFVYKSISEFLAFGGTICGLIGLFANEIFLANLTFLDYDSVQGLLSHSTMIFTTLFLLTQGYVKINAISLTASTMLGLLLFLVDGFVINSLYKMFNLPEVNAMYMLDFPLDIPGFNFITLGILGVIITFIVGNIYELIYFDKKDRWYNHLDKEDLLKKLKKQE